MKDVIIKPGCITCGACEFVAPAVFEVTDIARVKPVDTALYHDEIQLAITNCPVQVIACQLKKDDNEHIK